MLLKDWLRNKPFTLTMSSGFFSFFAHCGMLSVLEKEKLFPSKITGSSAGGMIGAFWGSGLPTRRIKEKLYALSRSDFWDPAFGFGILKGKLFHKLIAGMVMVERLEDCPIPVALSAFDMRSMSTRVFSSGSLSDAIYASCAVPFLFQPIRIDGRFYLDGGVSDRHGLAGARKGDKIFYHHISSRSPWRRKNSPSLRIPDWPNMVSLVIENLPRVGPNRLDRGPAAYEKVRRGTQMALEHAILENRVTIS